MTPQWFRLAVLVAAASPLLVPGLAGAAAEGTGFAVLALAAAVPLGWLGTPTLLHPGAAAVGYFTAARLLGDAQALPLALLAAAAGGAGLGLVAGATLRPLVAATGTSAGDPDDRRGSRWVVVVATLTVSAATVVLVGRRALTTVIAPPVFLGIDLGAGRTRYVFGLLVVAAVITGLDRFRALPSGRALAVLGGWPQWALRSGIEPQRAWIAGLALSGLVAGVAGALIGITRGVVPAGGSMPDLGVGVAALGAVLMGGGHRLPEVALAAIVLAVVARGAGVPVEVLGGVALLAAAVPAARAGLRGDR